MEIRTEIRAYYIIICLLLGMILAMLFMRRGEEQREYRHIRLEDITSQRIDEDYIILKIYSPSQGQADE